MREDFVSLAKEITRLDEDKEFEAFETRGGVMDGEKLSPERVKEISKWPSREEQLSLLSGQILGPGASLVAAVIGPGGTLASQIKQKSEEDERSWQVDRANRFPSVHPYSLPSRHEMIQLR